MDLATAQAKTAFLSDDDVQTLVDVSNAHGIDPIALGLCIYYESGFRPGAENPNSSATGLIQWMSGNAPEGYTRADLEQASFQDEMRLVGEWLDEWAGKAQAPLDSAGKVYATIVAPGKITPGFSEDTVLYPHGSSANPSWDFDKDGRVTVSDLTALLANIRTRAGWLPFETRILAARGGTSGGADPSSQTSNVFPLICASIGVVSIGLAYLHTERSGFVPWILAPLRAALTRSERALSSLF